MIEYISQDTTRTYYIVFDTYRGARMFWHWFTGKEYAHVYLLTELEGGTLLRINSNCSECLIDEWFCDINYAIDYLSPEVTSILRYSCKYNSLKVYIPRGIISCVSVTKYFLGLRGFSSFFPRGLHKQLLELGAEEMNRGKSAAAPMAKASEDQRLAAAKAQTDAAAAAAAKEQADAATRVRETEAAKVKAERDKAIQGGEAASDIAAREQSTLANPKKQKIRGRRSLASGIGLGTGVTSSREQLG